MGNSIKEIDSYNSCVICNVKMVIISHRRTYLGIQYSISFTAKSQFETHRYEFLLYAIKCCNLVTLTKVIRSAPYFKFEYMTIYFAHFDLAEM